MKDIEIANQIQAGIDMDLHGKPGVFTQTGGNRPSARTSTGVFHSHQGTTREPGQGAFEAVEIHRLADHASVVDKTRFDMNFIADSAIES